MPSVVLSGFFALIVGIIAAIVIGIVVFILGLVFRKEDIQEERLAEKSINSIVCSLDRGLRNILGFRQYPHVIILSPIAKNKTG